MHGLFFLERKCKLNVKSEILKKSGASAFTGKDSC